MSVRNERPGTLLFPLDAIATSFDSESTISVGVIHHPFNWFKQPEAMRPLKQLLESLVDIVITSHEHSPLISETNYGKQISVVHVEGGALQELKHPQNSSFNVLKIELGGSPKISSCTFNWEGTFYKRLDQFADRELNSRHRIDKHFRLSTSFEQFVDDAELPIVDSAGRAISLSDCFTYPDLRDFGDIAAHSEWKRVRAEDARETILTANYVLISGAESSGKSSLAKTLFRDLHHSGKLPLLLNGRNLKSLENLPSLRKSFERAVKSQYAKLAAENFEQLDAARKVLIIDDFDTSPIESEQLTSAIKFFKESFGCVILLVSEDAIADSFDGSSDAAAAMAGFQRFSICEFGHLRIEALASKWLSLSSDSRDEGTSLREEIDRVCRVLEHTLKTNAIPHHPWILLVLLRQVYVTDEVAAKNGSYGHLYNAVITAALARSKVTSVDIKTKYTYLSHFAKELYNKRQPTLDAEEMKSLHQSYCDLYDLELDYKATIEDLVNTGLLRDEDGIIAFRAKYSYCFFLAWYLNRHVHQEEVRSTIRELCGQLFHDESANTVVFLAHLCGDPIVLSEMKAAAGVLLGSLAPCNLTEDVQFLDQLNPKTFQLELPSTPADQNRRDRLEAKDEAIVEREPRMHDGRGITTHPSPKAKNSEAEIQRDGCGPLAKPCRSLAKFCGMKLEQSKRPTSSKRLSRFAFLDDDLLRIF
ncbi:NACHT domain-containing protein [Lacipirellula limnantheis]|uniref:STAND NTPase 4 small alpha/beta domain-containing protein n=1 Tax=Lacipirellula limnantheis TaxID=2528024 RepID=A0A517TT51_9BACT|nr:hypothetical protein [Lacipirellula limnantheis]QDT71555.1 hypothetical protein I41_07140 [Lacipirellula limnantheis]